MVLAKEKILHLLHQMPDQVDVDEVVERIKLTAKIEQALEESDKDLGQNLEEFKMGWLSES